MNAPDPFDMVRQSVLAIQTQNELAAARVEIARLKKELAEAQDNYHLINETVARLLKEKQANG
jgi:hypothetical protein